MVCYTQGRTRNSSLALGCITALLVRSAKLVHACSGTELAQSLAHLVLALSLVDPVSPSTATHITRPGIHLCMSRGFPVRCMFDSYSTSRTVQHFKDSKAQDSQTCGQHFKYSTGFPNLWTAQHFKDMPPQNNLRAKKRSKTQHEPLHSYQETVTSVYWACVACVLFR